MKKIIKSITFLGSLIILCAAAPTSGDYAAAVNQIQVNNTVQQSLQQVNNILCIVGLTDYPQFTNAGPTLALVNQNICNQSGNPGQQAGSNGGSTTGAPNYFNIIFDAVRANNSSPESVKIWITGNIGGGNGQPESAYIEAVLNVSESPSASNPYGLFNFSFVGYLQSDINHTTPMMQGYIRSELNSDGVVQLVFYQGSPGSSSQDNKVILIGAGTTDGYGQAAIPDNSNNSLTNYIVAYNSGFLLESDSINTSICYNRNSVTNYTYQYGVFNSDGSTLINTGTSGNGVSGYPVVYNGVQGFLSYYGLSLPSGSGIASGAPVQYQDPTSGYSTKNGTIYQAGGLMSQYNAQSLTFSQIVNVSLSVPSMNNGNSLIFWTGSDFVLVGTQTCDMNGCKTVPQATPYPTFDAESFATNASIFINQTPGQNSGTGSVNLYLNGLGGGGNTQVTLFESCSYGQFGPVCDTSTYIPPNNESSFVVWQNSVVAASVSPESQLLYCFQNCPYQSNGQWSYGYPGQDGSGGTYESGPESGQNIAYITYQFTQTAGSSANPTYSLQIADTNSQYDRQNITSTESNFIVSGQLLTQSQYLAITGGSLTSPPNSALLYQAGGQYYQWQTGGLASGATYNYFTGIDDDNSNLLSVVSPMTLIYNDIGGSGSSSFLQYSGPGNLQGIPGICVTESGAPTSSNNCGNGGTTWQPEFSIPDASPATDFAGNQYWVRPLFTSQVLDNGGGSCTSDAGIMTNIANAANLSLPESSGYSANGKTYNYVYPDNGSAPTGLTIKVINGISQ